MSSAAHTGCPVGQRGVRRQYAPHSNTDQSFALLTKRKRGRRRPRRQEFSFQWTGTPEPSSRRAGQFAQKKAAIEIVFGSHSFGEPVVDRLQDRYGLVAVAPVRQQAREGCGGAKLPGFGMLTTRHVDRFAQRRLRGLGVALLDRKPTAEAKHLGMMRALLALLDSGDRLFHQR